MKKKIDVGNSCVKSWRNGIFANIFIMAKPELNLEFSECPERFFFAKKHSQMNVKHLFLFVKCIKHIVCVPFSDKKNYESSKERNELNCGKDT